MDWLWRWDQAGFRFLHETARREWLDPLMKIITDTGLGHVQGVGLLLLATNRSLRPYALACFGAGAFAGLIRLVIVRWVGRQRPSNFDFATPFEDVFGDSSFPSGHTTTSFAIAIMLAWLLRGRDTAWVAWIVFGWACLVGISRIYVGVHYPTDVLGAAFLGIAFGTLAFIIAERKGWLAEIYPPSENTPIVRKRA